MLKILEKSVDYDYLYDSWRKESVKVFSKFKDDDFFSDKVEHVYFYEGISEYSVNKFQKILMNISKTKKNEFGIQVSPKPIVVHLNSPGGSVASTDIFYTIIQTQRVPLCVITEKLTASAATIIALLAPYKCMIDFSEYLIHDGMGMNLTKGSNTVKGEIPYFQTMIYYKNLLKKRTKLSDSEIKEFLERDMIINAQYCLKKGIIDRILNFPKINRPEFYSDYSNLQLNLTNFLKKTNLNHIYINSDFLYNESNIVELGTNLGGSLEYISDINNLCISLDNLFLVKKEDAKPIIIHFKPSLNWALYANANPIELLNLNYRLAMIQKRLPLIAFIEGTQYFDSLSTIMMCPIRIMMKPSYFQSSFTYKYNSLGWGFKTIDVLYNTNFVYNNVVKFYKKFTKFPSKVYQELDKRIINFSPEDLKKYQIVHLILDINKTKINMKNIIEYLQMENINVNVNVRK